MSCDNPSPAPFHVNESLMLDQLHQAAGTEVLELGTESSSLHNFNPNLIFPKTPDYFVNGFGASGNSQPSDCQL